jgi:hypothetical protein
MHGDDSPLIELAQRVLELAELVEVHAETLGDINTSVEKCWKELNGLRDTLENMSDRNAHR